MRNPLAPLHTRSADRDRGSPAFIAQMRADYPTETELDRLLNRKMQRRAGPAYKPIPLAQLVDCARVMLRETIAGDFQISDPGWLAGGASKIQMAFTLRWHEPGVGATQTRLVTRMDPAESINATSRRREFQLLQAMAGRVPVPRVYWVDEDARWFPEPTLIYAYANGVSKPKGITGQVTGVGTNFGPALRQQLAPQFIGHLASIHTFQPGHVGLDAFDRPAVASVQSAQWQLNRALRIWEEDRGEDWPIMEVAANWLQRNLPALDQVSVLHGDYRSGNFLFDQQRGEITAILDWERGYLGDRHRDLAWTTAAVAGHYSEDGKTFLASGMVSSSELLDRYEALSGLSVDPKRMRFYRIFNNFQIVVTVLGSTYRVVRLGKTHQDVLLAWLEGAAYGPMEEMRRELMGEI